mgnify:CR=1 FL=1
MSTATHVHTLQEYISQAMPVLMEIPGFSALATGTEQEYDATAAPRCRIRHNDNEQPISPRL